MKPILPPTLAEKLIRFLLPDSHAQDLIDDLAHDFEKRLKWGWSGGRARRWYWKQIMASDMWSLVLLLRARGRRGEGAHGNAGEGRRGIRSEYLDPAMLDLRYASRTIRRSPAYSALVVLTLALGIGANTALFSLVRGVILKPLPYPESDQLVRIREVDRDGEWGLSPPNFVDLREGVTGLQAVAAYRYVSATLTGDATPERIRVGKVTPGFFSLLATPPSIGRAFLPQEEAADAAPVAVLSHGAWQRRFAGDQEILGREIHLNGVRYTVVGVTAPDFKFGTVDREVWIPIGFDQRDMEGRGRHFLNGLGRLAPEAELDAVREEMDAFWAGMADEYPETNAGLSPLVIPLLESMVGRARTPLLLLFGAAGLVLLIACANVANLTLARAEGRDREFAIRSAIGSSRSRMTRQQIFEQLILGLVGGGLGLAAAYSAMGPLLSLFAAQLPRADEVSLDGRVLLFTLSASVGIGLLTAVIPILKGSWSGRPRALRDTGSIGGMRVARGRVRGSFVIAEVALSLMLVMGTALLLNSFVRLSRVDMGFQRENILTGDILLPQTRYGTPEEVASFYRNLTETLERNAIVSSVAAVGVLPLTGRYSHDFSGLGELEEIEVSAQDRLVTPGYFRTMGIPILEGRGPNAVDWFDTPPVAVLNETMAGILFPGRSALGRRVKFLGAPDDESLEVVGVVGDTRQFGAREEAPPTLYRPHSQLRSDTYMSLAIRTAGSPEDLTLTMREVVASLDSELPVFRVATMDSILSDSMASDRVLLLLLGMFGLVAVFLSSVGIFGVMSYSVSCRTQEIGVRMAVGGGPPQVLGMVVRQGMTLTAAGVALGIVGSLASGRVLTGMVFGIEPNDPVTLISVVGFITLVALGACLIPARRASTVDPAVSLREE